MKYFAVILSLLFLVAFTGQSSADFIIHPNGDAEFGKILSDAEDSIEFQFGCEKTEESVKKLLKKDLLNFGPHPYCQYPLKQDAEKETGG